MVKILFWAILLLVVHVAVSNNVGLPRRVDRIKRNVNDKYGVVIDAGSSGTRVNIYRWVRKKSNRDVVDIEQIGSSKIEPGLSSHAEDNMNTDKIKTDILDLLNYAKSLVPNDKQSHSPVYVMATGGLRLFPNATQVIDFIDNDIMLESTLNPFEYENRNTRMLSGEEEGVFAWIAVNYLLGVFKKQTNGKLTTYGILELGGASTQIAYHPDENILSHKFPVKIGGLRIPIYVHSYLVYGQNELYRWIRDQLTTGTNSKNVSNPCTPPGDVQEFDGVKFYGVGKPELCLALLRKHVYKDPDRCFPKPCGIGHVYQARIPPTQTFYAVGAFVHSLNAIGALDDDGRFRPEKGFQAAIEHCAKPIDPTKQIKYAAMNCIAGLYISVLFSKGYGFENDTDRIYAANKINGQPADWALGAIIYEMEIKGWDCGAALGSVHQQATQTYFLRLLVFVAIILQVAPQLLHSRFIYI